MSFEKQFKKENIIEGNEWNSNGLDIPRVQDRLFEIGYEVAEILKRNDVRYMIAFGTLLGAVRHQDMIPWDDDFDLFVYEEDYAKACEVLRKELPNDMFLEDDQSEVNYFHAWAHVKDMKSVCSSALYPTDDVYEHKGLHIDLFRLKRIKKSEIRQYLIDENLAYIDRRRNKGLITEDDYNRRRKQSFDAYEFDGESEDTEVLIFDGPYKQKTMAIEEAFPLKSYVLRGRDFLGPNSADKVLTSIYGNYMELPPIEKRVPKFSKVEFL